MSYEWGKTPPKENGEFYYSGDLPGGGGPILSIAHIFTHPKTDERMACIFIPPNWHGNGSTLPTIHYGELYKWAGEWAGPEFGLCCAFLNNQNENKEPS